MSIVKSVGICILNSIVRQQLPMWNMSLEKHALRLASECVEPLSCGNHPEMDVTGDLKADGVQCYQELIGNLRWAVKYMR